MFGHTHNTEPVWPLGRAYTARMFRGFSAAGVQNITRARLGLDSLLPLFVRSFWSTRTRGQFSQTNPATFYAVCLGSIPFFTPSSTLRLRLRSRVIIITWIHTHPRTVHIDTLLR
jgi:hypothetical protein